MLTGKLNSFNYNLYMLHKTMEMTKPVLEGMKTTMAVQWFLGNIFMIVLFIAFIVLLVLYFKRIKKSMPGFVFPKWIFIIYSCLFLLFFMGFNVLPQMGMEQPHVVKNSR